MLDFLVWTVAETFRSQSTSEAHTNKEPQYTSYQKMLDHEGPRFTLLWVPSHKGIPGNEKADQAVKEALDEDISTH
jgi:ribonuclease HI